MEDNDKNKTRALDFLNNLYEEKIIHKEHRHEFVKNKLLFTIGLFSIGSLKVIGVDFNLNLSILLYFIPFVALAFDVYIFSEDFKVKRIGVFILSHCESIKCVDENNWEQWLTENKNRENLANIASLILTIIALIASFSLLLILETNSFSFYSNLFLWFAGFLLLIIVVFTYSFIRRNKLLKNKKK